MKKTKSWKRVLAVAAFIALNVVVIAVTAANEFGNSETAAELFEVHINGWLILPALLLFIAATLANVYKYVVMIRRSGTEASRGKIWKTAWRVVMLGKYYDNITPAAIGGQPFQIYYMRKNSGLGSGHATSIPIFGMIAGQVAFLVLAIPTFIVMSVNGNNPALMTLAWVGLLFYAFWPVMIAGVSFAPKATTKFLKFMTKLLAKMRIVKSEKKALEKVETEVTEYAKSVKMILKSKGLFFATIICSLVYTACVTALPYFILSAFGGNVGFMECFSLTLAVTSSVYFIPTPGNAGAAEGTFYVVFSALSQGYVFWAMLVWRFFSYYVYILIGPMIYVSMQIEKRK